MNEKLSIEDVKVLSGSLTTANKIDTVRKVSAYYNGDSLTPKGIRLAEDIFRLLVKDVEIKVREILSDSLKKSKNIPADIVQALINDQESVAVPFIQFYDSFSKKDLLKILEIPNINKQKAVASRSFVPSDISHFIVESCPEEVVGTLISNNSAEIFEKTYDEIINKYHHSENIQEKLVYRQELPVVVVEKIVNSLSQELQKKLVINHKLPDNIAADIIEQVKEKATLKISEEQSSDAQIEELVAQLHKSGRLTPSLVVRSICMGDLRFFEYSISILSKTPIAEIRKILFSTSMDFMVRNVLRKASIPNTMFPAVFSALRVLQEIRFDIQKSDRQNFSHKVIERILSFGNAGEELGEDDIDYLVSKIS